MNQMTWVRGVNSTLGRVAPQLIASRLRERFMTPRTSSPRDWELPLLASSGVWSGQPSVENGHR